MRPIYCRHTDTIRQLPENYLLAHKNQRNAWVCDPDLAANKDLCLEIFKITLTFDGRYSAGEDFIETLEEAIA